MKTGIELSHALKAVLDEYGIPTTNRSGALLVDRTDGATVQLSRNHKQWVIGKLTRQEQKQQWVKVLVASLANPEAQHALFEAML
jgi:hypothetical protein